MGVSGLPSDPAFVKAIVAHDGGDASKVKEVTIGFAAVSRLLTKRVDAVPAFWNAEGVALKRAGLDVKEFRVEDYGAPAYPEVVLMTSRATLDKHRDRIERALAAIDDGLDYTRAHPDDAVAKLARAAETKDTGLVRAQLDTVLPAFAPGLSSIAACSSSGPTSTRAWGWSTPSRTSRARSTSRCADKEGQTR